MGNSLRCCLACVLPCGALDVIRIVHLNGLVEEITRPISAKEVLEANPNHVLSKPCTQSMVQHRILIISPESDLKRGSIYFLIPSSSLPEKKRISSNKSSKKIKTTTHVPHNDSSSLNLNQKVLSENKTSHRDRRSGRVKIWRPHLHSISEDS